MADRGPERPTLHAPPPKAALAASVETEEEVRQAASPRPKVYNEAAHKLGYWAPPEAEAADDGSEAARRRFAELADYHRDVSTDATRAALALGALGVVYGDIGTSPLYTEQAIFSNYHATAQVSALGVLGAASLIFWALTIVVSVKY